MIKLYYNNDKNDDVYVVVSDEYATENFANAYKYRIYLKITIMRG